MIKQEDISKILEATEIVDVINAFVPLRKRGVNYLGNCPFSDMQYYLDYQTVKTAFGK